MKPEAERFIAKAMRLIRDADTMLGVDLNDAAGRMAYMAAFHAAQAYIFEKTDRLIKTHKGVQIEFQRLTLQDPRIDPDLRGFLSRAYDFKAIADYETGPGDEVSAELASNALDTAKRFVAHLGQGLS